MPALRTDRWFQLSVPPAMGAVSVSIFEDIREAPIRTENEYRRGLLQYPALQREPVKGSFGRFGCSRDREGLVFSFHLPTLGALFTDAKILSVEKASLLSARSSPHLRSMGRDLLGHILCCASGVTRRYFHAIGAHACDVVQIHSGNGRRIFLLFCRGQGSGLP